MLNKANVAALCFVLACLLFFWWWASLGYPFEAPICEPAGSTENCSSYNIFFYAAWRLAKTADHWSVLITAIATGFIGWFTWSLRNSTERLWLSGEEHSERELKAYVFVDGGQFDYSASHGAFRAQLAIKNYGQTPAYDLEVFASARVFDTDAPVFDFTKLNPAKTARLPLGPGAHFNIERLASARPADFDAVVRRLKQVFVWGIVEYRDAFGNSEAIQFKCVNHRTRNSDTVWVMDACSDKND